MHSTMSATDDDTELERLAELLGRGPGPAPGRTPGERLRRRLRAALLRVIRPYSIHQAALDTAILEVLRYHDARMRWISERHGEQIDRLEGVVRELILAAESLRRGIEDAARANAPIVEARVPGHADGRDCAEAADG